MGKNVKLGEKDDCTWWRRNKIFGRRDRADKCGDIRLLDRQTDVAVAFWLYVFYLFESKVGRIANWTHGISPTEILGQLWKCTPLKILRLWPLTGRHQVKNTTTTALC